MNESCLIYMSHVSYERVSESPSYAHNVCVVCEKERARVSLSFESLSQRARVSLSHAQRERACVLCACVCVRERERERKYFLCHAHGERVPLSRTQRTDALCCVRERGTLSMHRDAFCPTHRRLVLCACVVCFCCVVVL